MKVLVDAKTERILGAAILGIGGDEVIHSILDIMYADAPYTDHSAGRARPSHRDRADSDDAGQPEAVGGSMTASNGGASRKRGHRPGTRRRPSADSRSARNTERHAVPPCRYARRPDCIDIPRAWIRGSPGRETRLAPEPPEAGPCRRPGNPEHSYRHRTGQGVGTGTRTSGVCVVDGRSTGGGRRSLFPSAPDRQILLLAPDLALGVAVCRRFLRRRSSPRYRIAA